MLNRRQLLLTGALAPAVAIGQPTSAFPNANRTLRILVPFAAGSGTDSCARIVANKLQLALGVPVIVDNRPGALGTIAATAVARAAPDGYTLLLTTATTHSAAPGLVKKLPFDPEKDFTPIARIGNIPSVVLVHPELPVRSLGDLIRYARANPGALSYGTGNSTGVIVGGALMHYADFRMTHVPYNSVPQAMPDFLSGRVNVLMADFVTALPRIQSGQARAIAVPSKQRVAKIPDVPPIADEPGFGNFDLTAWLGLFGPAGVPDQIVARLAAETTKVLSDPATQEQMAAAGLEAFTTSLDEFRTFLKSEGEKWQREIRNAKIEPR